MSPKLPGSNVAPNLGCRKKYLKRPTAEEVKTQAADRQRLFRARTKEAKDAADRAEESRKEQLGLAIGSRRYRNFAVFDNVDWICRVGSAPSAAGARAPLAGIVSNVTCTACNRWSVELYRWRVYLYLVERERERIGESFATNCSGMMLNFDETPTRFFCPVRECVLTTSTQVRCLSLYASSGHLYTCAPKLSQPLTGSWRELYGALDMESLRLDELSAESTQWKFLLVVVDAARANRNVARAIEAYTRKFPRLIFAYANCFAHILSNSTKWALGSGYPYGPLVRVSHVLQSKPLKNTHALCDARLTDLQHVDSAVSVAEGRAFWEFYLGRFYSRNGPFDDRVGRIVSEERVSTFHSLWPRGMPHVDDAWPRSPGKSNADYEEALRRLFLRTISSPVLSRWYSVESFSWFLIGARCFRLLRYIIGPGAEMAYWSGDDPSARLIDPARYVAKSRKRMDRVAEFYRSPLFVDSIYTAAISSIPRWAFARNLFPGESDACVPPGGVGRAFAIYIEAANEILAGKNRAAELLLSREDAQLRLRCYVTMLRGSVYLCEKNRPYTTVFWRIIRGELPPEEVALVLAERSCCAESGALGKIQDELAGLSEQSRMVALIDLCDMLRACSIAYCSKGGPVNLRAESAFSQLRCIGLKLPYRPITLIVGQRELTLRFVREWHKQWHQSFVERVYGNLRNMKTDHVDASPCVNGYTAFCRAVRLQFHRANELWGALAPEEKATWGRIAVGLNADNASLRKQRRITLAASQETGPLGSSHRWLPIDSRDVHRRLNDEACDLRTTWSKRSVATYKKRQSCLREPLLLARERVAEMQSAILAGDSCATCKSELSQKLFALQPLYKAVEAAYVASDGPTRGLVVCLLVGDAAEFFDLLVVMKNPRKLLAVPFDVTCWRETSLPVMGRMPHRARLRLPNVFDGRSCCLLDFCVDRGAPTNVWHLRKHSVVLEAENGWVCQLEESATEIIIDAPAVAPRPRAVRPAPRHVFDLKTFARMFGDDVAGSATDAGVVEHAPAADAEVEELGYPEEDDEMESLGGGNLSDRDVVRVSRFRERPELVLGGAPAEARISSGEHAIFAQKVSSVIDVSRYAVSVRVWEGNVCVYWKDSEKNAHWEAYVNACRHTKRARGCKELTSSKSSSISKHTLDGSLIRSQAWQQWHSAWAYKVQPTCALLPGMQLPEFQLFASHVGPPRELSDSSAGAESSDADDSVISGAASSSDILSTSVESGWDSNSRP